MRPPRSSGFRLAPAPLGVELIEPVGERPRLLHIIGCQQPGAEAGLAHAPAGVDPRAEDEGGVIGARPLVDAGDVVVHLFEPEVRAFYGLERLWSEAEQLDLPSEPGSGVAEAAR